ncbi:MAG: ABC transporter permease [Lachnospiraceae bacterium]|nr:ABC transporter permease [Lachnospiraceae bacterium]
MINVYELGQVRDGKVYSLYTLDTFTVGQKVANDFRPNALLAAYDSGEFESDGQKYTITPEEGALIVQDASGNEFAEFNSFSVRRYSGEDTMEYDLKKAVSAKIEEMLESGQKSGTLTHGIPQQAEDGSYMKDENGKYIMNDTELKITQRLEGEYVINCDQINYVIDTYASPSSKHVLGTDGDGFDMLARIMYGGRVSLMVGFVVVFIETFLGVIMGGLAGYFGGWVDNLIMRMVDIFYCLPSMPIMIILGAMMDAIRLDTYKRLMVMMAVLGVLGWAGVARLVRGQILSLREQEFMVATEATGIRIKDRIFKHLVPNVMPQLIVTATMGLGGVILTESTLSFLGLGVKHPLATWGTIINSVSSASAIKHYAFIWIPVGMLICLTVIAFNFVGDGLRDAYDPKAKR